MSGYGAAKKDDERVASLLTAARRGATLRSPFPLRGGFELSDWITLRLPRTAAIDVHRLLGEALGVSDEQTTTNDAALGLFLRDDHPLWSRHSGGTGHSGDPEWDVATDLRRATTFYRPVAGKGKVFLDLLIDHAGYQLDADQIVQLAPETFAGSRSIAGSINGLRKAQEASGRRYPFYWWKGDPAQYAMKPSVADLFRRARALVD